MVSQAAFRLLLHDSGAFMARLEQVKPFALHMPMVAAASPSVAARRAIERYFEAGRGELQGILAEFRNWLSGPDGRAAADVEAQRRFAVLRLRFQRLLTQFDLFADTLTQRSEHDFGVWLAGLDMLAHDSLALPGAPYEVPPLLCYLDRGIGAAIRRARTRLPGGGDNPVAIIRVPRERMIGTGVAGSLLHETGHQGAALLGLVDSLRTELRAMRRCDGSLCPTRMLWERWLSEIIADLWSVAMLGIGATYGMINVVALPRAFIFRMKMDDPHPPPWLRVRLSAAMGKALYPDPQWSQLIALWSRLYPPDRIEGQKGRLFQAVEASNSAFRIGPACASPPFAWRCRAAVAVSPCGTNAAPAAHVVARHGPQGRKTCPSRAVPCAGDIGPGPCRRDARPGAGNECHQATADRLGDQT